MRLEKLLLVPAMIFSLQTATLGSQEMDSRLDSNQKSSIIGNRPDMRKGQEILCDSDFGGIYGPFQSPYDWTTNTTINDFYSGKSSLEETMVKLSETEEFIRLQNHIRMAEMSTDSFRLLAENYDDTAYEKKMLMIGILGEAYNSSRYLLSLPRKISCEVKKGYPLTEEFNNMFKDIKKAVSSGPILEKSKKIMDLLSNAESFESLESKAFSEEFVSSDTLGEYSKSVLDGLYAIRAIEFLDCLENEFEVKTDISEIMLGTMYQYKILSIMNYLKYKDIYDLFRIPDTTPMDNDFARYTV